MLDVTASAKPAAPKTVTTKHLAYALAEQHQLSKKQSLEMVEELVGMITKHLKNGERVKIAGLGILVVRNRAARVGRNPMTGEQIQIKASKRSPSEPPRNSRWRSDRRGERVFSHWPSMRSSSPCPATAQSDLGRLEVIFALFIRRGA